MLKEKSEGKFAKPSYKNVLIQVSLSDFPQVSYQLLLAAVAHQN